jgi:RNA polymerase sigma-70 factor (ECF subfamily)
MVQTTRAAASASSAGVGAVDDPLAALVERCRCGDMDAFEQVVAETQSGVYNLAYSVLGNHEEAEDVTQEVYVRVWRALPAFRGEARFTTWLYRIAVNSSLSRRRKLGERVDEVEDDRVLERIESSAVDPTVAAIEDERNRVLWAAVMRLPEKYQVVINLFYRQQLTYEEMAEVLAMPLGTIKAQLNRARRALAGMLRAGQKVQRDAV